jgi:hypothetical protein
MSKFLLLTPFGFYFRIQVPRELRSCIGKRELKKSLKTTDIKLATVLAALYASKSTELFNCLRGISMAKLPFINAPGMLVNGFKQNPDGTIEFDSLETDPKYPNEEAAAVDNLFNNISKRYPARPVPIVPVSAPVPISVPPPAPSPSPSTDPTLSQAITDYCIEARMIVHVLTRKKQAYTEGFRSMIPPYRLFGILDPFLRIVDVPVTLIFCLFFCVSGSPQQRERMDNDHKGRQADYKSPDHALKPAYTERMADIVQVFNYFIHVLTALSQLSASQSC